MARSAVIGQKAGWQGATKENTLHGSSTEEQRSQTAFCSITLRAAGLLAWGLVVACVTARCRGMARAARTSARSASPQSPNPQPQHLSPFSDRLLANDAVEFRVERATGPFCRATRPTAVRKPRINPAQRCRNRTDRDRSPVAAGGGGESRGGIRKILFVATRCKPGRLAVRNSSCPTAGRTTRALNAERSSCVRTRRQVAAENGRVARSPRPTASFRLGRDDAEEVSRDDCQGRQGMRIFETFGFLAVIAVRCGARCPAFPALLCVRRVLCVRLHPLVCMVPYKRRASARLQTRVNVKDVLSK